ncbi:MAG: GFA family protein [Parvibaculum sp.]|nr:GFA family protein [Parvibaculum sp.]
MSDPVTNPINGRCLCGSVRFSVTGPLSGIVICHCSMCRRASGGAYGTFFVARRAQVTWTGETHLTSYESSPGLIRSFCGQCGSAATGANLATPDDTIILAANMLDVSVALPVIAVEYTGDKVPWTEHEKSTPHFKGAFPGWSNLKP